MSRKPVILGLLISFGLLAGVCFGKYSGGTGEPNDPYLIATPNDLNEIGNHVEDFNKCFVMVNDINLADYTGTQFNIIGAWIGDEDSNDYPFTGVFDGNGHTIRNFTYTSTGTNGIGLFSYVGSAGQVKNLGIADVNICALAGTRIGGLVGNNEGTISHCYVNGTVEGAWTTGCLAGTNNGGTITNCYATGSVSTTNNYTGGLVGENDGGGISNCYAEVAVSGHFWTGGLVALNNEGTISYSYANGNVWGTDHDTGGLVGCNAFGTISHCYASGDVTGDNSTGGLVGYSYYGMISHCYATGEVSGNTKTGGLVGKNTLASYISCFWNNTVNPSLTGIGDDPDPPSVIGETTESMQTQSTYTDEGWDFVGDERPSDDWGMPESAGSPILWWQLDSLPPLPEFSGGIGTADEPYIIASLSDLNSIGHNPRLMDKHFKLSDNINLVGESFYIIGNVGYPFVGIFDGNGHVISDFSLWNFDEESYVGLFGFVAEGGEVKGLGLENVNIFAFNTFNVGGLVGRTEGEIINCYVTGWVRGESLVGGLAGYNLGTISNCYAAGNVDGTNNTGGLVGGNNGAISNCHATGSVEGYSWYIGGLVGYNYGNGTICNSYVMGSVIGESYVGGLAGMNSSDGGTITMCYASTMVSGDSRVGGLVGENFGTVTDSFWDIETSDCNVSDGGVGLPTAEMQKRSTFADAGWDFVGEISNGYEDIWRMCVDGVNYPKLSWEFLGYGDLTCPDGVDFVDYSILANEWRLERLEQDYNLDGRVNFKDWAIFADNWEGSYTELPPFVACWLAQSARIADIAPVGGDDFVDWQDLAILAAHWLEGTE